MYADSSINSLLISEAYFEKNHLQRSYIKKKPRILIKILRWLSSIHPSSIPCFSCNLGHWGLAQLWLGEGVAPHRSQTAIHTIPTDNSEFSARLICRYLDCGKKPGKPERSHTDTDNMQSPHRKGLSVRWQGWPLHHHVAWHGSCALLNSKCPLVAENSMRH